MSFIELLVSQLITELAQFLSERFELDFTEVSQAIQSHLYKCKIPIPDTAKHQSTLKIKKAMTGPKLCEFVFARGAKKHQTCQTQIKNDSVLCSKHKNCKGALKSPTKHNNLSLSLNKIVNVWYITGTRLVVKNRTNKTVIGVLRNSGVKTKVYPLTKAAKTKAHSLNLSCQN